MTTALSNSPVMVSDFSAAVLNHYRRPRCAGELHGDMRMVCSGIAGAVKSGVLVQFQLRLSTDGTITEVGWQAYGCPSTLAAASWLAAQVQGKSVSDVATVTAVQISRALQLAPDRLGRAVIVEDAFRAALQAGSGD
ncbi:MAG: iron-sulfur cluster assembly scaffold protein [Aquisalimonadaceae bacterium]